MHLFELVYLFFFSEYIPRSGIAGSYESSIFSFLRSLHTVFYSAYTNLHSYHQCMRVSFSPHPCLHLLNVFFWLTAIPTAVRWYLTMVSIYISLMASNVEHLFMCLLAICVSFLEKYLFGSCTHFLIGLFVYINYTSMKSKN